MSKSFYEEVEIEDMLYDEAQQTYTYPCPCGDRFSISVADLLDGDDIATCPSCSLKVRVVFDESKLPPLRIDAVDSENH